MYNLHYLFRCLHETYYFVKYFCNFCFLATKITYFLVSTYHAIIFQTFFQFRIRFWSLLNCVEPKMKSSVFATIPTKIR